MLRRTSLSMEVLMSSSLPSCRWTELMLKTILVWFWPSEDDPNRVHFCFPDLVKSHITNSPLRTQKDAHAHTDKYKFNHSYNAITDVLIERRVGTRSSWTQAVLGVPVANGRWARASLWPRDRLRSLFSSDTAASESSRLWEEGFMVNLLQL